MRGSDDLGLGPWGIIHMFACFLEFVRVWLVEYVFDSETWDDARLDLAAYYTSLSAVFGLIDLPFGFISLVLCRLVCAPFDGLDHPWCALSVANLGFRCGRTVSTRPRMIGGRRERKEALMPLFTHHPSLSWPPFSPNVPSSPSSRATGQQERSPAGAGSALSSASIDEDPFAYFITPPSLTVTSPDGDEEDGDDQYDVFEDLSAGILPDSRPRSRSLSPFRTPDLTLDFEVLESTSAISPGMTRQDDQHLLSQIKPAPLKTLRRLIHIPRPSTPRLHPQQVTADDVPELSPLPPRRTSSFPSATKERSRGRGRSRVRGRGRGRGSRSAQATDQSSSSSRHAGGKAAKTTPTRPRLHSDRPRSWREPSWDLWTVLEERDWTQEEMMAMVQQAAMYYGTNVPITTVFIENEDERSDHQDDGSLASLPPMTAAGEEAQVGLIPTHDNPPLPTTKTTSKLGKRKKNGQDKKTKKANGAPRGYASAKKWVKRIRLW